MASVFLSAVIAAGLAEMPSYACSRVVYVGDTTVQQPDSVLRIVGRSLDWRTPIPTIYMCIPKVWQSRETQPPTRCVGPRDMVLYMLLATMGA